MLATPRNRLLAVLSEEDRHAMLPFLTRRTFARFDLLEEPPRIIQSALFVEEGVLSVLAMHQPGFDVEVTMIGREGMTGVSLLNGIFPANLPVEARTEGWGYEIKADALHALLHRHPSIRDRLSRYQEWRHMQMAMVALSGRQGNIEENLARVLLMLHDRIEGDILHITHEELARHISARRPGVTNGIHILEGMKLIRSTRGTVEIIERPALEEFAGTFYGQAEDAWFRMLAKLPAMSHAAE